MLSETIKNWLQIRFRNDCLMCSSNLVDYYQKSFNAKPIIDFCPQCHSQFRSNMYCCLRCAIPLKSNQASVSSDLLNSVNFICGACQKQEPLWTRSVTAFLYEYPVDRLLIGLKYQNRIDYANSLAGLLMHAIELEYDFDSNNALRPDCIVPVPLHLFRECMRGYNQAYLLAKSLAKKMNIPLSNKLINRVRHTPQQSRLTKKQRAKNLRNAFVVNTRETIPKYVALVDDVMTTGSTAHAVTKALLDAGVQRVDVWCVARAE